VQDDGIKQIYGSRERDGHVPHVNWNGDNFNVNWYHPDNANEILRVRQ